jgi:hypothetical protein
MNISIIKSSALLLGCLTISVAYGSNLVAFGEDCLAKETRLNKAKIRLEQLSSNEEIKRIKANQSKDGLEYYQNKLAEIDATLIECAETTPNSAYCHQSRRKYNELTHIIQAKLDAVEARSNSIDSNSRYEINKINFSEKHAEFIALCRDSDTHYAIIQDSSAYMVVCQNKENKHTVTCSLF